MKPGKVQKSDLKTQVKEELQKYIRQLDLTASNKLPREEALAEMLGVSRITLRSVLDDMAAEGIIFRRQGRGTFVNPVFFEMNVSFNPVMHFSDMIRNSGYDPKTEIVYLGSESAGEEVAGKLKIAPGSPVTVCTKFFFADGSVCAMAQDYIAEEYAGALDPELFDRYRDSVFYYIYRKTGRRISWDKVEIDVAHSREVQVLHEYIQKHGGKDKPYLLLKGVNYDEEDREVIYSREYIDTAFLKFSQIRKRYISYDEIKE
ncbi:MAG: GntR family transcriptional regulator [Bariatricus sp.]